MKRALQKRREILTAYAKQNNITREEEWYKVKLKNLKSTLPSHPLTRKSLMNTLKNVYPHYQWEPPFFSEIRVPSGFWNSKTNRKKYFEYIANHFQFNTTQDWFLIPFDSISSFAPKIHSIIKKIYKGSLFLALSDLFPPFSPLHSNSPLSTLDNNNNNYNNNYYHNNSHYNYTYNNIPKINLTEGNIIFDSINKNEEVKKSLKEFDNSPRKFWKSIDNQRLYLNALEQHLGINKKEDWYKITYSQLQSIKANRIYNMYHNLYEALSKVYPDHPWQSHLFSKLPQSFWRSRDNQLGFVRLMVKQFKIRRKEDWYRISTSQLKEIKGSALTSFERLSSILSSVYKEEKWNPLLFHSPSKKSAQRSILLSLQLSFPHSLILENYLFPLRLFVNHNKDDIKLKENSESEDDKRTSKDCQTIHCNPTEDPTKNYFEIDMFIPSLNKGFEYNGEQHYNDKPQMSHFELIQLKDHQKTEICRRLGIDLLVIPYWSSLNNLKIFDKNKKVI